MKLATGLEIEENFPLAPLTSWVVGGSGDYVVQPRSVDDVRAGVAWANERGLKISILGGGTNVLISDRGVRGLTIVLRKLSGLTSQVDAGVLRLTCLSGTSKSELLKTFLKLKLEPALFLAGLPGDVGGGVVMNAGVGEKIVPREFVEITEWIEVLRVDDGRVERIEASGLEWNYRHCAGWQPGIIVRVGLKWPLEPGEDVLTRVRDANRTRLSKQPLDLPSCGSVFRNPSGTSAGRVVEECGLKGYTVGGAKVSEKHANFIVNFRDAKATDIHQVIEHVKTKVHAEKAIELRTEVVYLGDWS